MEWKFAYSEEAMVSWMSERLKELFQHYKSLYKCNDKEMNSFIEGCILEEISNPEVHLGSNFVPTAGNFFIENYHFCINEDTEEMLIFKDEAPDSISRSQKLLDWSVWDAFGRCVELACEKFIRMYNN